MRRWLVTALLVTLTATAEAQIRKPLTHLVIHDDAGMMVARIWADGRVRLNVDVDTASGAFWEIIGRMSRDCSFEFFDDRRGATVRSWPDGRLEWSQGIEGWEKFWRAVERARRNSPQCRAR